METKKQTVEYIASVEHLDKALTVVSIKGWLFLLFSILLGIGVIIWAFIGSIPVNVQGKALLFDPSNPLSTNPQTLKIYAFIPLNEAAQIQSGMEAKCSLNTVNSSTYGMLRGTVREILPYPASLSDPLVKAIPSESLRKYLIGGDIPSMLILIDPIIDATTPSGLSWTSKEGPPEHLESGMIGLARITLDNVKPISYVIPSIRKK